MHVVTYVYDSETAEPHVEAVRERIADREESPDLLDVAAAADRDAAIREATLTVRDAVRIGSNPGGIYDENGTPDFSAGVLITERPTGRRDLHVGNEALDALDADRGDPNANS